jgi:Cys-tRNA(Pro)/Cys-tRNA(Cys) deacylase
VAREATGYERGTITPLGFHRPVAGRRRRLDRRAGTVTVGGGGTGCRSSLDADELLAAVDAEVVDVTRTGLDPH